MSRNNKNNPLAWLPKRDAKQIQSGVDECLKYIGTASADVKTAVMKVAAAVAYGVANYPGFADKLKTLNKNLTDAYIAALVKLGNGGSYASFLFAYTYKFSLKVRGIMDLPTCVQKQLAEGIDVINAATGVTRHVSLAGMTVSEYILAVDKSTGTIRTEQQQRDVLEERKTRSGFIGFDADRKQLYAKVGSVSCALVESQVMSVLAQMLVDNNRVSQFAENLNMALKAAGRSLRCVVK